MERNSINNAFYDDLAEGWYTATDHPVALLRAENRLRIPWILDQIGKNKTVLDIGCGAGLLTNALAKAGHKTFGIDVSASSLQVAQKYDATSSALYQVANGYDLPFPEAQFDVVCAMDLLEHVEEPQLVIREASRVLKPGGLFFFHTFNRNLLSYLLIIKGVEWLVPNAPRNMHVYPLFIKPEELREFCHNEQMCVEIMQGLRPQIFSKPFLKMLIAKNIPANISFCFSKSLATGYCGRARKSLYSIHSWGN